MRVLVTGSRSWSGKAAVYWALGDLLAEYGTLTVVHGAARSGADKMAHDWALSQHYTSSFGAVTPEPHPADWRTHRRRAGYLRNEEMVRLGAVLCLAFIDPCAKAACAGKAPHGSHGASHCAGLAEAAGIPVRRIAP